MLFYFSARDKCTSLTHISKSRAGNKKQDLQEARFNGSSRLSVLMRLRTLRTRGISEFVSLYSDDFLLLTLP